MCAQSCNRGQLFETLWTVAHQAPVSMEFFRQEYWSGLPFSTTGDPPNPGMELHFLHWQADSFTNEPPGKPHYTVVLSQSVVSDSL